MNLAPFSINETNQIIPDAYHAANREYYETILNEGFRPSRGQEQWLGDGVYFWESTLPTAHWWGKKNHRSWVIFQAKLKLGRCLNLANRNHCAMLKTAKKLLSERGWKNCPDAAIINFLHDKIEAFDSIRTVFPSQPIFIGSRLVHYNPIICMRELNNIIIYGMCAEGDRND